MDSFGLHVDLIVLFPKAVHVVVIVIKLSYWKPEATHHSVCLLYDMFIIFLSVGFMVHSHGGTWVTICICFWGVWIGSEVDNSASLTCGELEFQKL